MELTMAMLSKAIRIVLGTGTALEVFYAYLSHQLISITHIAKLERS